nr:Regulatory protein [Ipomoea batatas]
MLVSLLLLSAPVLLLIADAILPSALLSASASPASIMSLQSLSSHLSNYDFRYSLIDIPLISILRSAIILCVYSLCDGPRLSRGPYLGIATICSVSSLVFLSLKAGYIFGNYSSSSSGSNRERLGHTVVDVALFTCSFLMAIAHIVMAYRISCRERRKLLVFKIDIETAFQCRHGKAYLFNKVRVNVTSGKNEDRMMTTGLHTVADIFCVRCGSIVGWKYETAYEKDQKYKEGRSVLERFKISGPEGNNYWINHEARVAGSDADDV